MAKPNIQVSTVGVAFGKTGYDSIIYIAALSGIDPALYEAATVDGASKLRKIMHITLPSIAPTIIITAHYAKRAHHECRAREGSIAAK